MMEAGLFYQRFDIEGEPATVGSRWKLYLKGFELFADARGLIIVDGSDDHKQQRLALLLHSAGPEVQRVFDTFPATVKDNKKGYAAAIKALNDHFVPTVNIPFQRNLFREMQQDGTETVAQFVIRLREVGQHCNYGDLDDQIRDQIVQKCRSVKIKRKLLETGSALTLKKAVEIATSYEQVDAQLKSMAEQVNAMNFGNNSKESSSSENACYRCGRSGHYGRDSSCPAKTAVCKKCNMVGHFANRCRTKVGAENKSRSFKSDTEHKSARSKPKSGGRGNRYWKDSVKCVETETDGNYADVYDSGDSDDSDYAFRLQTNINVLEVGGAKSKTERYKITCGGIDVYTVPDSGSTANTITEPEWKRLKRQNIICESTKHPGSNLYPYQSEKPLKVLGQFRCTVTVGNRSKMCTFRVVEGSGENLLSRKDSEDLGLLKIGYDVKHVGNKPMKREDILIEFPNICSGIGRVKDREIELKIDPNVKPVVQPLRRIPFALRDKLATKLRQMVKDDIIEPVEEATGWGSNLVVVPKRDQKEETIMSQSVEKSLTNAHEKSLINAKSMYDKNYDEPEVDDIRVCVDMRCPNKAILRERHPIPSLDEILHGMNGAQYFSKIDIKSGYNQFVLSPASRNLTCFTSHIGLFRYKVLLFGINTASEIFQNEVRRIIRGIPGVENISDDICVSGNTCSEHDERLRRVLVALDRACMTINYPKSIIGKQRIPFFGIVLSKDGISLENSKIDAIMNAREPENATELRSWVGLCTYCSKFIPDFSTRIEPLRNLTRKDEPFVWGKPQQEAFDDMKRAVTSVKTLGHFDKDAATQVVCDASPVGLGAVLVQYPRIIAYASRSLSPVERRYSQTEREALGVVWACEKFHLYVYGIEFELLTDHKALEVIYGPRSKPSARIERWVLRLQPYVFNVRHIPGKSNIADCLSRLIPADESVNSPCKYAKAAEDYVRFVSISATPESVSTSDIEKASKCDNELAEIRKCVESGRWEKCDKKYIAVSPEICRIGYLLLRGTRIIIPAKLRQQIVALAHEGHLGIVATKQMLRSKVWWPGMERDAEKFCKSCHGCQLVVQPDPPEPLRPTELPDGPWQALAADFKGPLPSGHYLLVIVDYFSRYYEVAIMLSTTADKMISVFHAVFARHVTPEYVQANGEVERQNSSLEKKQLRIAQFEKKDWKHELQTYLAKYRSLPHATTGVAPAKLLFNRDIRTKLPQLSEYIHNQELRDRDHEQKGLSKFYADASRSAKSSDVNPGDEVLVKDFQPQNKLSTPFRPEPHTVIAKSGNQVTIESPEGVPYKRNTSHVKLFHRPENPPPPELQPADRELAPEVSVPAELMPSEPPSAPNTSTTPAPCRRSDRKSHLPSHLKDYVLSQAKK